MTAKQTVINILSRNPQARNDDRELFLTYFEMNGLSLSPTQQQAFRNLPFDMETIRRTRQVVQNDEKQLLANPFVQKARLKKEVRIREQRIKREWIFNAETQIYREVLL